MKTILRILPVVLLAACTGTQNDQHNGDSVVKQPPADTLYIGGKLYELDSISEATFNAVASTAPPISKSENEVIPASDTAMVKRADSVLTFKTPGGVVRLVSNTTTENVFDEYVSYRFVASLPEINQWFVDAYLHEGYYGLLIDQRTGKKTEIWSRPHISPDKKHFATCSADLEAGFVVNGFQVFENTTDGPKLLLKRELADWAPDDLRWKNDSTLYIMKSVTENNGYRYSYRKMIVR